MAALPQARNTSIFRIDSFAVPAQSRGRFLAQLEDTKAFLGQQRGCLQNHVLEYQSGADRFNMVTVVEWESKDAFEAAKSAMMAKRRDSGFNPEHFLETLGVEANMTNYAAVA